MTITNQIWTLLINYTSWDLVCSGTAKWQISLKYNYVKKLRSLRYYFVKFIRANKYEVTFSELKQK